MEQQFLFVIASYLFSFTVFIALFLHSFLSYRKAKYWQLNIKDNVDE
jgi:hypothetical protein